MCIMRRSTGSLFGVLALTHLGTSILEPYLSGTKRIISAKVQVVWGSEGWGVFSLSTIYVVGIATKLTATRDSLRSSRMASASRINISG